MDFDPAIFKSYDIRGIYPADLNETAAYAIGRAYARHTGAPLVAVGSDMRLSGPALKAELIRGLTDEGVRVADLGLVPIDLVYFAVRKRDYPAGVMITASHNPKEYNGFKLPLPGTGWIRGITLKETVDTLPSEPAGPKAATEPVDIWNDYIEHVLSFVDTARIKPLKVVVDAGNGMAGAVVPKLAPHLPIEIIPLNFELDGNFPAHPSNPLDPASQVQIAAAVKEHGADCGVIFDGDTDRLFFVDEHGTFIPADLTLLVLAKEFLRREPGAGIVYNAICSKIVPEKIAAWGGRPLRSAVGFVNVMETMAREHGIMGGELSAHYCFRDNGYADSGFIAWLILLELLSRDERPLSAIVQEFQVYHKAPELNIVMEDAAREAAIARVKDAYRDAPQDEIDGLTITFDDWWFNIRKSNTEPLLRLTMETLSPEMTAEKLAEVKKIIEE